jgi:HAD superfamily hydrolase (TIGR01509 family)
MSSLPSAVLFDFDGVISDTENLHIAAWERTLGAMGWSLTAEASTRAGEIDDRRFATEVFASKGIHDADVEGWVRRKQKLMRSLINDSPRIFPGFVELVQRIAGRTHLAVVATTWRENVEVVLQKAGIRDGFDLILGYEDLKAVKPDPQGFKMALKKLKVTPRRAMALEDSSMGLMAAQLAGVRYLIVGHGTPPAPWVGGAPYVSDFADVEDVLLLFSFLHPPTLRF